MTTTLRVTNLLMLGATAIVVLLMTTPFTPKPEPVSLANIYLVDPIMERMAAKRYPNDLIAQRAVIHRWDSVRREVRRRSANGWKDPQ